MYRCCLQQYSKQIDEGRSIISLSEEEIMTDELENLILIYMLLKANEKRTEGISGTKCGLITKQALLVISDFFVKFDCFARSFTFPNICDTKLSNTIWKCPSYAVEDVAQCLQK